MSKSKGKTLSPEELIDTYSADAVRYLPAKARLGQDSIYDEQMIKTGHRLLTKIFNASRFVQMQVEDISVTSLEDHFKDISAPIDQAWLSRLLSVKIQAIKGLKDYNYAEALERIEKSFWLFCDNYIELVKARVYQCKGQASGLSGQRALDYSLYIFLKLFAPYFPYVTEEIWQNRYNKESSSIHKALWLEKTTLEQLLQKFDQSNQETQQSSVTHLSSTEITPSKASKPQQRLSTHLFSTFKNLFSLSKEEQKNKVPLLDTAFSILEQVRSQKADQNKSLTSPLEKLEVTANTNHLKAFELVKDDLARASHIPLQDILTTTQADAKKPIVKIQIKN